MFCQLLLIVTAPLTSRRSWRKAKIGVSILASQRQCNWRPGLEKGHYKQQPAVNIIIQLLTQGFQLSIASPPILTNQCPSPLGPLLCATIHRISFSRDISKRFIIKMGIVLNKYSPDQWRQGGREDEQRSATGWQSQPRWQQAPSHLPPPSSRRLAPQRRCSWPGQWWWDENRVKIKEHTGSRMGPEGFSKANRTSNLIPCVVITLSSTSQ